MAANIICTGDTTILRVVIDFKQTKLEVMLAMSHTENPDNFSYDQFTIITPCGPAILQSRNFKRILWQ